MAHILSGSCAGNKVAARNFMRELDKHAARATARVERTAPDSKDTATFLRRARAASLKAMGSKFGALAEEEYDKIAPVIACTLPALTDSIPERKRKELAGEVTRELQVVGNAASIAIRTWVRSNDKSKARAEEREKNIGWIRRMFTAWRVSHTERREEREAAGEVDDEEDDTPVVIPSSAVTTYPRGTPVPTPSVKVQVIEERVDLSNNLTWRQMIGVGVRRVVLARGELDKLEGPQYAARRAELRREAGEAARARDRQAAVALQNEAEESGATEEESTGGRTTRVGRPRGGMGVAARIGDRLRREIRRGRRPRVVLRSLPLAAACRRLPLVAAGRPPQIEDEDYVVAAAAGAAGTRGARRLRRDAVRHRAWRAERIGASGHRVAVRASATESGAEEDEAGAAWKGGNLPV